MEQAIHIIISVQFTAVLCLLILLYGMEANSQPLDQKLFFFLLWRVQVVQLTSQGLFSVTVKLYLLKPSRFFRSCTKAIYRGYKNYRV